MKKIFKISLKIVLSIQLCFIPSFSYSAVGENQSTGEFVSTTSSDEHSHRESDVDSSIQSMLEDLKKQNRNIADPEVNRRLEAILDLTVAIENGRGEEYLRNNPQVRQERDHFLLADQTAETIEYHFSNEEEKVVERVEQVINLNDYASRPIHTVFKKVRVQYDSESRILTFEGISGETVMLRQHIPDMDIIGYVNDNEVLAILDKKRGLILVDMFFARAYLGLAPVPVFRVIPVDGLNTSALFGDRAISLEFINRSIRPPDVVPDYINNIGKNFQGNSLFEAGDLMISALDPDGKKHLVQFLKRTEIAGHLKLNYEVLDIMTKVVAPHLMEAEDLKAFKEETDHLKVKDPKTMLDRILSTLFTKSALQKFLQAGEGVKIRSQQLDNMSPRDRMLFQEWHESFQQISERLQDVKSQPSEDTVLSTEEIASHYEKEEEKVEQEKNIRVTALRIIAGITSSVKKGVAGVGQHKVSSAVVVGIAGGFVFPETFIWLANIIFPMIRDLVYSGSFTHYAVTSIPNLITMMVFLPIVIYTLATVSIPFMKKLKTIFPKNISLAGKIYHPEGWMEDVINKWDKTDTSQKIVGMGMKIVAYSIYPFWNYLAGLVGQPHFFSAIQKGLNPFQKVDPKSDIGETAKLTEPVRFGIQTPHWRHNGSFNRQRQLQNAALSKNQRIQSIAWLMASLAVAGKTGVSPEQIIIYGTSSLNFQDLEKVHNDMKLKMEMIWVMKHLMREIQVLGEIDIRKELSEIQPEMIIRYYERSKELALKARSHSDFRRMMRNLVNTGVINTLRRNLSLRSVAGLNKTQHEMLKNVPSDFVTNRVITEFIMDHLLVSIIPLLTTDRAEFGLEHFTKLAVNDANFSWSSKPHLNEVWLNVIAHFFIAGGQRTMTFTEKTITIQKAQAEQEPFYEPLERHTHKIKPKFQGEATYYGKQFAYLGSGGKKDNLGGVMWRSYVSRLRSLQMTFSLMVALRMLLGGQGPVDAVLGFFLYHFAGQWMFGWPWDIIAGGARLNGHELAENQKKMDDLRLKLSRVARALHTEQEVLQEEYRSAVNEIMDLYTGSRWKRNHLRQYLTDGVNNDLWQHVENVKRSYNFPELPLVRAGDYDFPEIRKGDMQTMRLTSEKLINLLVEHPPLPNQPNKVGNWLFTALFGATLTTILFVTLSVWTFSPEHLTLRNIGAWAAINYMLYFLFYVSYKKGLKDHVRDIKNWREYVKRQKESFNEWKEAFKNLKAPEESWNRYFYDRFLEVGRSASAFCRGAFRQNRQ